MCMLCLESGGTKLVAAVATMEGKLIDTASSLRKEEQTAPQTVQALISLGRELLGGRRPKAVGFGFGGTVQASTGQPRYCFHERGWEELDSISLLEEAFAARVFAENDCNLAALAEAVIGFQLVKGSLLYLTIGTGIGGGFVVDGKLLRLGEISEMEIGHVVVEPDGPLCECGNRGCLEVFCSGPGLGRLCRREFGLEWDSIRLMEEFRSGDRTRALPVVNRASDLMARALAPALNLLSPGRIVLGGGVMQANEAYLKIVETATLRSLFPAFREFQRPRFSLSNLKRNVVCQGAALYALRRLSRT